MTHAEAIRTQIQEIEAEVRKDPRLIAIEHLKAALRALEGVEVPREADVDERDASFFVPLSPATRAALPRQIAPAREESKIKRTADIVGRYVDEHGPTHRLVLVKALTEAGLMEGVKNPPTALATSMHTLRDYFTSNGFGTWRRREGAPTEIVPIWTKKAHGNGLHASSPNGETEGVAPSVPDQHQEDMRAPRITARSEAGGT
jgi:hypothetical protein